MVTGEDIATADYESGGGEAGPGKPTSSRGPPGCCTCRRCRCRLDRPWWWGRCSARVMTEPHLLDIRLPPAGLGLAHVPLVVGHGHFAVGTVGTPAGTGTITG